MARTDTFLPAGTRIAIRQPGNAAEWYTTKKQVNVDVAKLVEDTHPVSGDPCARWTEHGILLYFPARVLRSTMVLEDGDVNPSALNEQFSLFHYDVPKAGGYPNPSNRLYPMAVRITESCWIVKTHDTVILPLMAEMQDNGCKVRMHKFDKSESRALLCEAIEEMRAVVAERVASANASLASATAQLDASDEEGLTEVAARKRFENRIKSIERTLTALNNDLDKAAKTFGLSTRTVNLMQLGTVAKKSRERANEKAAAYVHGVQHLLAAGTTTTTALANAALTVGIPTYVMAGALEDAGDDKAADRVQAANDDDDTFSLSGD